MKVDQKMVELWPKNVCPYLVISALFDSTFPHINIFDTNQHCLIGAIKRTIFSIHGQKAIKLPI